MATKHTTTIAGQISAARALIEHTGANPRILELVSARGYHSKALAEGQNLLDAALRSIDAQAAAAGAGHLATEHVRRTARGARVAYQGLAQTVRAIYPANAPQRKALDVVGPAPDETARFLAVAMTLFNNALGIAEIGDELARYGYDAATLARERELVVAYQDAVRAQAQAKGRAQQATRDQTEALRALHGWTARYAKIAKIALRSEPELLKVLGLALPGARPSAPRGARARTGAPSPVTAEA